MEHDKIYLDHQERMEGFDLEGHHHEPVRFPVELELGTGRGVIQACDDFVLDVGRRMVFVGFKPELTRGAKVELGFYLAPHGRLLQRFKGKVVWINTHDPAQPRGVAIRLIRFPGKKLKSLVGFLDERRHLVDAQA